jgi:chromosome segregation ATPase
MHFLSNAYRRIKLTIASASGLAGLGALIAGIAIGGTGGTVLIIGGSLWVATSGFSIFDSVAAYSAIKRDVDRLEKNVDTFSQENLKLEGNIRGIEIAKDRYVEENRKLTISVKRSQDQVKRLSDLKIEYEQANADYQGLLDEEKTQITQLENQNLVYVSENQNLSNSLNQMKGIQDRFKEENEKFKHTLEMNDTQISALESAKDEYVLENGKLQETNEKNEEQLDLLKNQVIKLRELYSNSRELLKNLSDAGDMFSHFGNTLGTTVVDLGDTAQDLDQTQEDYENTLGQMKNLIDRLKTSTYGDLDKDGDGLVTKEEFDEFVSGRSE